MDTCILPTVLAQCCNKMSDNLCSIETELCNITSALSTIESMLAHDFPMSIAAEYPTELEDRVVYSTIKVRFLDMLNPNMYVLFKGIIPVNKPVYFKDTSGYEHIVSLTDGGEPILANTLINNQVYPALYIGNYIVIS